MTTLVSKKPIYIVDDDESVCRALSLLLNTYGFTVGTFGSAEAFFGMTPKGEPGCVILDLHMPGLNGWQALEHLVKIKSPHSVIIISAEKSEGLQDKAVKAGALGFLQKPFNDKDLVELINKAD